MKKATNLLSFVAVLTLLVSQVIFAQFPFWEQLALPSYPQWSNYPIQSIRFDSLGNAFAASNYGVIRSLDTGATWTNVLSAGAFSIWITPAGTIFIANGSVWRSSDSGGTWVQMNTGLTSNSVISVAVKDNGLVFAGAMDGSIFRSTDGGQNWQRLRLHLGKFVGIRMIDIASDGTVLAGTTQGRLYRSSDNGRTWHSSLILPSPRESWSFVAASQGEVFATGQGYRYWKHQFYTAVFRSVDNGRRFSKVAELSGILPRTIDADKSGNVFIGSESGVYVSSDHGVTWNQRDSGLTNPVLTAIRIAPDGFVYAGTGSGEMYRSIQPLSSSSMLAGMGEKLHDQPLSYSLGQNYPNPFNPSTTIEFELPTDSKVVLKIYNLLGQIVATLTEGVQPSGHEIVEWNASSFPSGTYFYRLEATSVTNPTETFTSVRKMVLIK